MGHRSSPIIWVTTSNNDRDLVQALGTMAIRAPIPHGDCAFHGVDDEGKAITICVERKKIPDIVKCMGDGRYMQQLRQAREAGFTRMVLIIEGRVRPGRDGILESTGKGGRWRTVLPETMYSRLNTYLDEVAIFCGVQVKRSMNVKETAAQVKGLWLLYQKPAEEHGSLKQIFTPPAPRIAFLVQPGLVRRVAKELPGIEWALSAGVEKRFKTVAEMVEAPVEAWMEIPRVGKVIAQRVRAAMHGEPVT